MPSISERNRDIGRAWRDLLELPGAWRKSASQAGGLLHAAPGEAGGFFVELDAVPGRRAYLKPLKRHGWRRAAREKIASDLACVVGVVVPPVLLAVNDRHADAERWACVSLLMYPHQFSWGQLRDFLAEGESPLVPIISGLMAQPAAFALAFDTWLDQTDHDDHPSNIVFGYEGNDYTSGQFVFLDYAFSMGVSGTWKDSEHRDVRPAPFPPRMCSSVAPAMLDRAISAVEGVPGATVQNVVDRIPWQWLPDEEKAVVKNGLLSRQRLVRAALRDYLGGPQ